jgi:hypothetical protein
MQVRFGGFGLSLPNQPATILNGALVGIEIL